MYIHVAVLTKVVQKKRKAYTKMPKKLIIDHHLNSSLCGQGIMDSALLLKCIGYFSDYPFGIVVYVFMLFLDNLC